MPGASKTPGHEEPREGAGGGSATSSYTRGAATATITAFTFAQTADSSLCPDVTPSGSPSPTACPALLLPAHQPRLAQGGPSTAPGKQTALKRVPQGRGCRGTRGNGDRWLKAVVSNAHAGGQLATQEAGTREAGGRRKEEAGGGDAG